MIIIQNTKSWDDLPFEIKEKIEEAPLFYTKDYEQYLRANNQVLYFYGLGYLQVVCVHEVAKIFKYAIFPTEPFNYLTISNEESTSAEFLFLNELINEFKRMKIHWTSVTPASTVFMSYPEKSLRIPWGNYIIDLNQSEDDLFKNVTSKHRNMIRRGEKSEIEVKYGGIELLSDYLLLDSQTWERSGVTVSHEAEYRRYLECLPNNAIIGIAYKDSVPQCGLLGLYSKACFYYQFGASAHKPEPGSTHYLQWKTILKMKEAGVKQYSFVGCRIDVDKDSKLSNIQHFKSGFGGTLVQSYLFKCDLNKFKVWLFKLLLYIKSGKYPKDAIDQEISKWKELNEKS